MTNNIPETFVPGFHDESKLKQMKFKQFGTTGLQVSELSIGTGGFSYFYGDFDIEECRQTVHEAIKSGINYIDTGPWYGHGTSEEILGKCLEGIPRKAYYLATKVGRYEKDPKLMFEFSREKTMQSIDASLKRLKLDYVDILQVHDIEFAPDLDIVVNETLPALEDIVRAKKARFIGITGYPVSTLLECIEKSTVRIDMILSYCRLTMIDNTLETFVPALKARKIGIVNAAANSMGLLSNQGPPEWHPACKEIKEVCEEAAEYCKKHNIELGKVAVYYSLKRDGPDTTLVGMNTRKLLNCNLEVLKGLSPKEEEVLKEVERIFQKLAIRDWENFELQNYKNLLKGGTSEGGFFK